MIGYNKFYKVFEHRQPTTAYDMQRSDGRESRNFHFGFWFRAYLVRIWT